MGQLVTITSHGDFKKTTKFLDFVSGGDFIEKKLRYYGEKGVALLHNATPSNTGKTADSWGYKVEHDRNHVKITWTNDNMAGGVPVVILLQYGHATKGGTYVQGIDFINPVMQPLFNELANEIWEEVVNA